MEFKQANLASSSGAEKAFADDSPFDVVYNLAAETKYGQSPEVRRCIDCIDIILYIYIYIYIPCIDTSSHKFLEVVLSEDDTDGQL